MATLNVEATRTINGGPTYHRGRFCYITYLAFILFTIQEMMNATLPTYTVDDGQGFIAEDHTNITNEEELTNVTMKTDANNDTGVSFRDENHEGIENDEVKHFIMPIKTRQTALVGWVGIILSYSQFRF